MLLFLGRGSASLNLRNAGLHGQQRQQRAHCNRCRYGLALEQPVARPHSKHTETSPDVPVWGRDVPPREGRHQPKKKGRGEKRKWGAGVP